MPLKVRRRFVLASASTPCVVRATAHERTPPALPGSSSARRSCRGRWMFSSSSDGGASARRERLQVLELELVPSRRCVVNGREPDDVIPESEVKRQERWRTLSWIDRAACDASLRRRRLGSPTSSLPWHEMRDRGVGGEGVERERGKAEKAQHGHLEQLELLEPPHRVDPLLGREEVEAFPDESAHETGEESGEAARRPVAPLEIREDRERAPRR